MNPPPTAASAAAPNPTAPVGTTPAAAITPASAVTPSARPQPQAIAQLTGLRILLATWVLTFHDFNTFHNLPDWLTAIIGSAYFAVVLFFVLSGFVLAYNYLGTSLARPRLVDVRGFWAARIARVYPLYVTALLLLVPFAIASGLQARAHFFLPAAGFAHLAAVQTWVPAWVLTTWNIPGWTIGNELFFYLLFPFLAPWLLARCPTPRTLWAAIGCLWLAGNAAPILYVLTNPDQLGRLAGSGIAAGTSAPWLNVVAFYPLFHLPAFLTGVACASIYLHRPRRACGPRLAAAGALLIFLPLAWGSAIPYPLAHNGLLLPGAALLILGLALGAGRRLLSHPTVVLLGDASYAAYILQLPLKFFFRLIVHIPSPRPLGYPAFLAYFLFLIAISLAAHRYLELPARRCLRRALSPRPLPAPSSGRPVAATPSN